MRKTTYWCYQFLTQLSTYNIPITHLCIYYKYCPRLLYGSKIRKENQILLASNLSAPPPPANTF
jgi:hypothetical protein